MNRRVSSSTSREHARFAGAFDALSAHDSARLRFLQPGGDADRVAGLHVASDEHVVDAGAAGNLAHDVGRNDAIVGALQLLKDLDESIGAQDLDVRRLRKIRHHHVGEPRPHPVERGVTGVVVEVEHGDAPVCRTGSSPRAAGRPSTTTNACDTARHRQSRSGEHRCFDSRRGLPAVICGPLRLVAAAPSATIRIGVARRADRRSDPSCPESDRRPPWPCTC